MRGLRWRIGLLAAAVAAAATRHGGAGWPVVAAAAVLVLTLVVALPPFVAGALRGAATPSARDLPAAGMSGVEFEDRVAGIVRAGGVGVIATRASGDWGVDLIAGRRPHRLAIQCKRQARPVGAAAVQEVVAGAAMHGCAHTMVVTNHGFTPAARTLAATHGCALVGGDDLGRLGRLVRALVEPAAGPPPAPAPRGPGSGPSRVSPPAPPPPRRPPRRVRRG